MPERRTLRILLIGEESAGVQMLRALARTGHQIVAVMTSAASRTFGHTSLATVAGQLGYATWPARFVKDPEFAQDVTSAQIEIILNVHSLYIVHDQVLQAARIGAFNMHPAPLPQYSGLNTVSWAIYRGETNHAVTIHWMTPQIDAGDIVYRSAFRIEDCDTPLSLTHKCVHAGVPLVLRLLEAASANPQAIPRRHQNLARRQYFGKEIPEGGRLSWQRSAREIVDFVRACDYIPYPSPWGHPMAMWEHGEIAIVKAARTHLKCDRAPGTVGECDHSGVLIAGADEWVSVRQLKIDGRYLRPEAVLKAGCRLHDGWRPAPYHGSAGS
jgi:methionyl-tRNA formyltransferase